VSVADVTALEGNPSTYAVPTTQVNSELAVFADAVDAAGNVAPVTNITVWLDTTPPSAPPTLTRNPDAVTLSTDAVFEMHVPDDGSPGQASFWYLLVSDGRDDSSGVWRRVPELPASPAASVTLSLSRLAIDASHLLRLVTRDQLQRQSATETVFTWRVVSVVPPVLVLSQPANISALYTPSFTFAVDGGGSGGGGGSGSALSLQVQVLGGGSDLGTWHSPCRFAAEPAACLQACNSTALCRYTVTLPAPATYTLQVRAALSSNTTGAASVVSLTYKRCADDEFAVLSGPGGDAVTCRACPTGGVCRPEVPTDVVTQADIVARAGYWASPSSDGSRFYRCPVADACLQGGVNGSRAVCATGYDHVACSLCADGYFEQFGKCAACPSSSGTSAAAVVGIALALAACGAGIYAVRDLMPVNVIKLGVSMLQIIASANSAYDIPWPPAFRSFLSSLRVFLVDVVSTTQTACAQPMNYYASLLLVLVGLKVAVLLVVLVSWAWSQLQRRGCACTRAVLRVVHERRASQIVKRASGTIAMQQALEAVARQHSDDVAWVRVFRSCFMLLFVAYPGVSLKMLQLFKCRDIDGVVWLAADMRLRCYDARWSGYAVYVLVMGVLYIVGLPAAVLYILWRRRHKLFGSSTDPFVATTRAAFGFLYVDYGVGAWWWEVEELLRKLLLSAVVVLIDEGSPLQVTLAVLVSGWAHVLHAMYKPWGVGTAMYALQHGSLFVTSFVFLMGLLFKVHGVGADSQTYSALSGLMMVLCVAFLLAWLSLVVLGMARAWRDRRRGVGSSGAVAGTAAAVDEAAVAVSAANPLFDAPRAVVKRGRGDASRSSRVVRASIAPAQPSLVRHDADDSDDKANASA
jgi:hypothetical protein